MNPKDPAKYDLARRLYVDDKVPLKEIAQRLGTTPQTLTRWKQKGAWAEKRQASMLSPRALYQKLLKQLDLLIEEGDPAGNADAISKICKQVKELQREATVDDVILVLSDFSDWLLANGQAQGITREWMQEVTRLQDTYVHALIAHDNRLEGNGNA